MNDTTDNVLSDSTKGILGLPAIRWTTLILGNLFTWFFVVSFIAADRGYLNGYHGFFGDGLLASLVFLFLLLGCCCLFGQSVWLSSSPEKPKTVMRILRSIDMTLLMILAVYTLQLCFTFALNRNTWYQNTVWILLSMAQVAYALMMLIVGEVVARLRDRSLNSNQHWFRYFKRYALHQPAGLTMACTFACALLAFILLNPGWEMTYNAEPLNLRFQLPRLALIVLAAMALVSSNLLCRFILSLGDEYELANQDKIRSERFKAELITGVSHDLRTPLTALISYIGLIKTLPIDNEDFDRYTGILDSKAARLKVLTDDLLEASKAATGNLPVDKIEIDLAEIVGQISGEFDDQFTERSLSLVFEQPGYPVAVSADSRHLWRVLENLFGNIARYAMPQTRVFADIFTDENQVVLSLKNTSEQPIDLPVNALTEQFIRGDSARQSEGSGLGLYIAKCLIELMDGVFSIRVIGDLFVAEMVFDRQT